MFQMTRKNKQFTSLFSVMERILKTNNDNPNCNYVNVRTVYVDGNEKKLLEVCDAHRCLKVTTTMIPVVDGRYAISKNTESWFLTMIPATDKRYPDTDRIEVKHPTKTYKIASCVSNNSSVYSCVVNKKSSDDQFTFFNPAFLDDFIKLVEMSYPEVIFKCDDKKYSPVQLEFENSMFEFKYIVMPMTSATTDVMEVTE